MEKGNDKRLKSILGSTGLYVNKERDEKIYDINISSNLLRDYFSEPSSDITDGTNYTRYMNAGGGAQKNSASQADGMRTARGEDGSAGDKEKLEKQLISLAGQLDGDLNVRQVLKDNPHLDGMADVVEVKKPVERPEEGLGMEQAAVNGVLEQYFKNSGGMGHRDDKPAGTGLEAVGNTYNHDAQMNIAEINDMMQKSITDDMLKEFCRKGEGKEPTTGELLEMRADIKKHLYMQYRGADAVSVSAGIGPLQFTGSRDEMTGKWYFTPSFKLGSAGLSGSVSSSKMHDISDDKIDFSDGEVRNNVIKGKSRGGSVYSNWLIGGGVSRPVDSPYEGKVVMTETGLGTPGASFGTSYSFTEEDVFAMAKSIGDKYDLSKKDILKLADDIANSGYMGRRKKSILHDIMENPYGSD